MHSLFDLFLQIALFRKGPQDVPPSVVLRNLCVLAYLISSLCVILLNTSLGIALLQVFADTALLTALLLLGLQLRKCLPRFTQTLSALMGVGTLLSIPAWPLIFWITAAEPDDDMTGPSLLLVGLVIWSVSTTAHILRHALNLSLSVSACCALGYTVLSWTLMSGIG